MADQDKKAPKIRAKESGEKGEKVEKPRTSSKEVNNDRPSSSSKEQRPESSRKEPREPSARSKEPSGGERKTDRAERPVMPEPSAQKGGVRKESSRPSSGRPPMEEEEVEDDDDDDDDEDLFGGGFDELGNYLLYQNENGDVLNVTEVLLLNKQSIDKQTEVLEKINKTLAGIAQGLKK